ncbi:response regulator [candidate division KSB1 bacterium]
MKKILITEDTLTERMFLEKLLQKSGFETVSVENGVKALEKLYSEKFDLILSDLMMPAMDGMELLKECQEKFSDIPFIMISAFAEENQNAIRALKEGAEDCVFKEFKNQELISRINKALLNFETKHNLKKSQREFKALIDNLNDTVFSIDRDGKIVYLSRQWEKILEKKISDWLGRPLSDISVNPENKIEINKIIKKMFREGNNLSNFEIMTEHNNGKKVYLTINAAVLKDNKGNFVNITGTARDVTEKISLEQKIANYSKDLEELLKSRTNELEKAKLNINLFKSAFFYCKKPALLLNKSFEIVSVNKTAETLLGNQEEDLTGKKISNIITDKTQDESIFKEADRSGKHEIKVVITNNIDPNLHAIMNIYSIKDQEDNTDGFIAYIEKIN